MTDLFTAHTVEGLADVSPFASWLSIMGREERTLAIVVRDRQRKIALSSKEDAWVVDLKTEAAPLAASVLLRQLLDQNQVKVVTRNASSDIPELVRLLTSSLGLTLEQTYDKLNPLVVGDLTAAARCINQVVTAPAKFRKLEQDAFEIALLLPQYEYAIAPYYQKIGVPLAKLLAQTALFGRNTEVGWWVSYHYLWLRVLAFYTGDPTLAWAFHEGRDPLAAAGTLLKCTPADAELYLLWQACGRDMACFEKRFPSRLNDLPDDLLAKGQVLDTSLPAMSNACSQMQAAYWDTRTVNTRYERVLRPGSPMGEAVAFRVFGTVEELISIAAVTFWNNRPASGMMITKFQGGPAESVVRIAGTSPGRQGMESWLQDLRVLAPLANPLGQLDLTPQIVLP